MAGRQAGGGGAEGEPRGGHGERVDAAADAGDRPTGGVGGVGETHGGPVGGVGAGGEPPRYSAVCDLCGTMMYGRHCKLVCQQCGYTRDCSDP